MRHSQGDAWCATDHHATHEPELSNYRVTSHVLDSGTVTIGLSTVNRDDEYESTTLYLTKEQAKEVYAALDNSLASR